MDREDVWQESDSFRRAREKANPLCAKCNGTGNYQYTTHGTPHFTICDLCCKHDRGWWKLQTYYGELNGKLCCLAGCGFTKEDDNGP